MYKYLTIFGFSTALVLSAQAFAHPNQDNDEVNIDFYKVGPFTEVDTNGDGKISEQEYLSYQEDRRRYDKEWRQEHWAEMIEKFDENGDNQLEVQEIENYTERRVAEVMEEFHDRHGKWLGKFELELEDLPELHEFTFTAPRGFMFHSPHSLGLKNLDSDEDGAISREEFVRERQELFERLDENDDGLLDENELENFSWFGNYALKWHKSEDDEE